MTWQPDVESLRLLVLVGRHRSLGAAARLEGVSQPAASKRLALLERRLGVRLLDRTRRGSTLTAAGQLVSGWATRVLDDLDVLVEGARALRREATAHLAVAASLTVAEHVLPGWLGQLRRGDPELRVGLEVTNSSRVCELVGERAVDLGFIESPNVPPGLRSRTVARDRLVLVVAAGHPWARRRRAVGAAELARTPLVSREAGSGTRAAAERAIAGTGAGPVEPLLELGSSAAVRSTVLTGAGPALLSELVVAADVAAGLLVDVPTDGIDLTRRLRLVWPAGSPPVGPAADLVRIALRASPAD